MSTFNMLILFLIFSFFFISSAQPHTTLMAPLNKDPTTSLPTILLNSGRDRYVADISAPFSWRRCPSPRPPGVECFTSECTQATYLPSQCPPPPSSSTTPCICTVAPQNPITQSCSFDQLIHTNLSLSSNSNKAKTFLNDVCFSCAPTSLFESLPRGVVGLASLSLAPLSLQNQFSDRVPTLSRKFSTCLPSTSSRNGAIFFGDDAPYASSLLSWTPLLTNPKNAEYAVGIKALTVAGTSSIAMSPFEAIRLSTVVPYTTLVSDVYKKVVGFFEQAMKGVPKVKSVKPFTSCYKASAIGDLSHVPRIDLEFEGGKNWTIRGANSMKRVGGDTACLAFVDGGAVAALKIVIGAFQMEDTLLVFDLDGLRFGFSNSLLLEKMSCSGNYFNFTT